MKLTFLLLTVALLSAYAEGRAQVVTISGKDLTLKQVFGIVEKQTGYVVFTRKGAVTDQRKITLTVFDMPLRSLLDYVLKDQPLKYAIEDKTIIIARKENNEQPSPVVSVISLPEDRQPVLVVTGTVSTPEGELLSGASVRIKNSNSGTSTDSKGFFRIQSEKESISLLISMIGYQADELLIEKSDKGYKVTTSGNSMMVQNTGLTGIVSLKLFMRKSVDVMDETVVTAYGRTTKKLATGSIGIVKGEDLQRQYGMTVLEGLIGQVPGLTIERLSGNSAAPLKVTIRGRNTINSSANGDPLYVIDGVPFTILNAGVTNSPYSLGAVQAGVVNTEGQNPLLHINPADIERVDVLKDADATAIYGSRGANGVILITTKRPQGGPTSVSVSLKQETQFLQHFPGMMNTEEYLAVRREAFRNDNIQPDLYNAPDLMLWDQHKYTDWQRFLSGIGSNTVVNASVNGGAGQTNYRISGGYNSNKTIMNNGGKNQVISFMSSVTHSSKDKKFNFSLSNTLANTQVKAYSMGNLGATPPNAPDIYDRNGQFNFVPYRGQTSSIFPFTKLKQPSFSEAFNMNNTVQLSYKLIKGLSVSANASYSLMNNDNNRYEPAASKDPFYGTVASAIYGFSKSKSVQLSSQVSYNTHIGKGKFSVQLIGEYQGVNTGGETIYGNGFANDDMMKSHNNANQLTKIIIQGLRRYKYVSTKAILNYNWADKYVINLNANRDGSSRFGPGKQFGNFGSIGLAWIASEEKWLKDFLPSWFSFLKFRGSTGITGGENIGEYEYLTRWGSTASTGTANPLFKYNGLNVFHPVKPLNQDFQWESNRKHEMAASIGLINNRITIEIATYRNIAGNQLTSIATPVYTGFSSIYRNWEAKIKNSGIEFSIIAKLIDHKDYGFTLDFNISRNRNRLLEFPNLEQSSYRSSLQIGQSLNFAYLLRYTGIDPMTGTYSFEDYNKDGNIYSGPNKVPIEPQDDRSVLLDLTEKYSGNGNLKFNYKAFSCVAGFYFTNRLRKDPYLLSIVGEMTNMYVPAEIRDQHWQYPGHQAKYPKYTTRPSSLGPVNGSDAAYVNGTFLRMNSLSLFYNMPSKWTRKVGAKSISLSVNTNNLFTLTPYKGIDPEIDLAVNATPIPRVVGFGLNVNF